MINDRRRQLIIAGSTLLLPAIVSHAADDSTGDELRIGLIFSLTGPAASYGIPEHDGVVHTINQINKRGGIRGKEIVYFTKDDQSNATQTATAARDMILNNKVQVIIGPTIGTGALAMGPIAARNKVPFLAPVGTIPVTAKDSGFYDWVFRYSINDARLVAAEFDFYKKKNYSRLGLFFTHDAYGEASGALIKKTANETPGVEIVVEASAAINATDVSVQASKLLSANPDIIVTKAPSALLLASLLRQIRSTGSKVPVVVSNGLVNISFIKAAGADGEGVIAAGGVTWDKPTPLQAKFLEGYDKVPSIGEGVGGALFALEDAVRRIKGPITGVALREALEQACPIPTLWGPDDTCYSRNNHDGDLGVYILEIHNGKWTTME